MTAPSFTPHTTSTSSHHPEDDYFRSYTHLNGEVQKLVHTKFQTEEQQKNLEKRIVAAKDWIVRQPQLQDFTEKLQQYLQQKNVIAFNEMLSGFVDDVLEKDKRIELELYTSHSLPALKIRALNQGHEESIMEGSGGSLANIVSTGLRIIAAARSPNRKFLVLDEADCWIKPERIELFAKVIGAISLKLNMQIVMISHHSSDYFKNYGRVIEVKKVGGKLEAHIVSDIGITEDMKARNYIERLRLQDFMSHEDTVLEFHPNITCIIGENDIGKSAVGACFRAFARGASEDGFVKHDKEYARATLDFDHGWQLLWQRNKKLTQTQKQKVLFETIYQGQVQAQEYNSHETPAFVADKLNIRDIEGIDVHLAHQKEPTFLIDNKTRPQDKAKILSLGKESFIVQKMMEKIKEKGKILKQDLKGQEAQYHDNSRILLTLADIEASEAKLTQIHSLIECIRDRFEEFAKLKGLVSKLQNIQQITALSKDNPYEADSLVLEDTTKIQALTQSLQRYLPAQGLSKDDTFDTSIQVYNTPQLAQLIAQLHTYQALAQHSKDEPWDTSVHMEPTARLAQLIETLKTNQSLAQVAKSQTVEALENLGDTQRLREMIKKIRGAQQFQQIAKAQVNTSVENDLETLAQSAGRKERLHNILAQLHSVQQTKAALLVKQENAKTHFAQLEEDKAAIHKEMGGVCPCCGSKISSQQLFENHI